jgi:hypothetical protein
MELVAITVKGKTHTFDHLAGAQKYDAQRPWERKIRHGFYELVDTNVDERTRTYRITVKTTVFEATFKAFN